MFLEEYFPYLNSIISEIGNFFLFFSIVANRRVALAGRQPYVSGPTASNLA